MSPLILAPLQGMCDQLAVKARHEAQGDAWNVLRKKDDMGTVQLAVDAFLNERLMPLALKDAEHYNENGPLGEAIREAVAVAQILSGWPQGLQALAEVAKVGQAKNGDESLVEGGASPSDLSPVEDAFVF